MDPTANASSSEEIHNELSTRSAIGANAKKPSNAQKLVNSLHGVVVPKVSNQLLRTWCVRSVECVL